jgi:hypothetical protein
MVNGFESANASNGAGFPAAPRVARPTLLIALLALRDGLIFSCKVGDLIAAPASRSGIVTACTGVTPPKVLLPPQNALAARRGDVEGRSLWILGVNKDDIDAELRGAGPGAEMGRGPGGGRTGELERPAAPRRVFLSALISCCSAAFSDFVEPSSTRMASMSRSRSATSPSSALIYSVRKHECQKEIKGEGMPTLATVAKVASANLVAQLAFFPAGQLLVLLGRGAPVVHGVVERVCLYYRANIDLFLDPARMNDWLAILAFIRMSNRGRSERAIFVLVLLVLLMTLLILYSVVITKVTWSFGSGWSGHELRVDGKRWREGARGAGSARVRAVI